MSQHTNSYDREQRKGCVAILSSDEIDQQWNENVIIFLRRLLIATGDALKTISLPRGVACLSFSSSEVVQRTQVVNDDDEKKHQLNGHLPVLVFASLFRAQGENITHSIEDENLLKRESPTNRLRTEACVGAQQERKSSGGKVFSIKKRNDDAEKENEIFQLSALDELCSLSPAWNCLSSNKRCPFTDWR